MVPGTGQTQLLAKAITLHTGLGGLILLACLAREMWADWQHFGMLDTDKLSLTKREAAPFSSLSSRFFKKAVGFF